MTQQPLIPDLPRSGIFEHLRSGHHVDHNKWLRACAERGFVGMCRECGNHLKPETPTQGGALGLTWYQTVCVGCGKQTAAPAAHHEPGGRFLARSSRWSQMPGQWWHNRLKALKFLLGATRSSGDGE
jgi:hypothetical protein